RRYSRRRMGYDHRATPRRLRYPFMTTHQVVDQIGSTVRYRSLDIEDALALAKNTEVYGEHQPLDSEVEECARTIRNQPESAVARPFRRPSNRTLREARVQCCGRMATSSTQVALH